MDPDCGHGQIVPEGQRKLVCESCKEKTCIRCQTLWHSRISCEKYMKQTMKIEVDEEGIVKDIMDGNSRGRQ